jgi:hypothetical protein
MAARTIVTSHPDVACDVCGRRLLRGEQPDVFLGSGQRRLVCELCTSRATHEGWRRETEEHAARPRPEGPQRGRSLLGRLRQLREPARPVRAKSVEGDQRAGGGSETPVETERTGIGAEWTNVEEEWAGAHESWESAGPALDEAPAATERAGAGHAGAADASANRAGEDDASVRRALEVFNVGEYPRRVAGVARALGAPSVRATQAIGAKVAIVVAWELCWYRYEIDLGDEARGARVAAEGMELGELAPEDLLANATADERGELSLVEGV